MNKLALTTQPNQDRGSTAFCRWCGLALVCLIPLIFVGCQVANPSALPIGVTTPHSATYKPAIEPDHGTNTSNGNDSSSSPASLPASARVRGQSPSAFQSVSAGAGDSYRNPMQPTVVQPNYNAQQVSPPPNYYAPSTSLPSPNIPPLQSPSGNGYASQAQSLPAPTYGGAGATSPTGPAPFAGAAPYGTAVAPGATNYSGTVGTNEATLAPGVFAGEIDPALGMSAAAMPRYEPRIREADIDIYVQEARTGRIILGGSVNSDLGVAGNFIVEERNFDIGRFPTSWRELWSGRAFRGAGQNFRAELMPGSRVQRYTVNWSERNLFGYAPMSLSVGGFLFTRQYRDWTEQRLGGRVALGYDVTRDLSLSTELRMEDVKVFAPRILGVPELDRVQGSNDLYTGRVRLAHDTRDSPFMATEGHYLEVIYDQVFGEFDYPRGMVNFSRYFLVNTRADGGGRQTLASTWKAGISGVDTPLFENFFAGGYSTLRGFSFRGASPKTGDVQVGGRFMFLGSLEYVFPLTADDMLRGIAFVDYGTVEKDIELTGENFRVAPGLGLRVSVPALGPAPLAFDFAIPVATADTDDKQVFSFFMGFTR